MKKFFCLILFISILALNSICIAYTNEQSNKVSIDSITDDIISPRYIVIMNTSYDFKKLSGNKLKCAGRTTVEPNNIAKVIVELQRYEKDWKTIETWTDTCEIYARVETEYYVEKNYIYRLKITYEAYTENMKFIECNTIYSDEIKM